MLAGVLLSQGRDVRMPDDPRLGNVMGGQDLVAELDQRIDLGRGVRRQRAVRLREIMPAIDDLDADGPGVQILVTLPAGDPGMPGPAAFGHHLVHPAILPEQVMGRDLCLRVAELVEGGLARHHAGIVQHQHVDGMLAVVEVRAA
jgi:hypothetical protein